MEEKQLKTEEFKGKDGKIYYSLTLKPKDGKDSLQPGQFVVVEKTFPEGLEKDGKFGKFYICRVNYDGKDCSLLLNTKEHDVFKIAGGAGAKVKISLSEEPFVNPKTKIKMLINRLKFELA